MKKVIAICSVFSFFIYSCSNPQINGCSNLTPLIVTIQPNPGSPYQIEIQAEDNANGILWGQKNVNTGALDGFDGDDNTNKIVSAYSNMTNNFAAKVCEELVCNNHSDWYLPSKEELNIIYQIYGPPNNNSNPGNFKDAYWSSTEINADQAFTQNFNNGHINNHFKNQSSDNCRCVRKIPCSVNSANLSFVQVIPANGSTYEIYIHPTDNANSTSWGNPGITTGANDGFDGYNNTLTISNFQWNSVAKICHNLVAYGCDDWYLPAKEELEAIYNIYGPPNNNSNPLNLKDAYWSSTEINADQAFTQNFNNGHINNHSKTQSTDNCRCVRKK
ncbi:MAG: DUF1566 domain-containing protein [Saprospiraceae bacterium]